ncbi:MAG: 2-oxoacid:acceptor oxidoreductase family protein [Candidatus Sulfomarinibacteraceae bacterium]
MTERTEIRITGFGGQGVVLSGHIIGRACAVHADMHATMIQSFGPEARGSACSTTLAVSDTEVLYPYIGRPDVFVVMSAEGYDKYRDELRHQRDKPVTPFCRACEFFLQFAESELAAVQPAMDRCIEMTSDDSAYRDDQHAIQRDATVEGAQLEVAVVKNEQRAEQSQDHVHPEPAPGGA